MGSSDKPIELFHVEITCVCPSTGDTFTRIAECLLDYSSVGYGKRLAYEVQILDDPNPKAKGPCKFYPESGRDPRLWIGQRLAQWLKMFLSYQGPEWHSAYELIELDDAVQRRIAMEV
jgi:hypothetical protein